MIGSQDIAIVGMSGRFPGAKDLHQFWRNLRDGVESISFFSKEESLIAGVDPSFVNNANHVGAAGLLDDVEMFDAQFFGYNPREAETMDPQQRLFLECAWHALEDAGYDVDRYAGAIGVYAGCAMSSYLFNLFSRPDFVGLVGYFQVLIGNDKDYLTTRTSYKLNLTGPSVTVQTACSTSLVAVTLACQSLLAHQCDMALAGGVNVRVPQKSGYLYQSEGIYSPDGHCRAFDATAQGTVFGNGLGVVVLKRMADAQADRDHIYAVIKGFATNNDGYLKVGYTAPGLEGQAEVIATAHATAGVHPETITYIESHGTGTSLGDPIEIEALTQAFAAGGRRNGSCAIGSVKTNIGHLDPAAGIASLIKTALSLEHRLLPPSLHFVKPNPGINFEHGPFYVNAELSDWKTDKLPRRAGVSAFGIGGTNAHVILEEAPPIENTKSHRPNHLLVLSAKSKNALNLASENLANYLAGQSNINMADVAYTLQVGRRVFSHRRMVVVRDVEDATNALQTLDAKRVVTTSQAPKERPLVFMFSGQGSQYVNMSRDLYQVEPGFRRQVDLCLRILEARVALNLRDVLFPRDEDETAAEQLKQTMFAQPALFIIEYALAMLLVEWGIFPQAMIGHSLGEYVAACLSGVFSLEDALLLVAERGKLMQQLPSGAMLAVPLSEKELAARMDPELSLAAINAPELTVVSGPTSAVNKFEAKLTAEGIECRRLQTSHAFHSAMMDPILDPFTRLVESMPLHAPEVPYISNITGEWITEAETVSPRYWANHLRSGVRFAGGLQTLMADLDPILVEVGPGRALSSLAMACSERPATAVAFSTLRHPHESRSDWEFLLHTLGRLWLSGVKINWSAVHARESRHRITLPPYPFERQRYWIGPERSTDTVARPEAALQKRPQIAEWLYVPAWKRSDGPGKTEQHRLRPGSRWLVFEDLCGIGSRIRKNLDQQSQQVITVRAGKQFVRHDERSYEIDPRMPEHYGFLMRDLMSSGKLPDKIVHLWSLSYVDEMRSDSQAFEEAQDLGFYSILHLAQALMRERIADPFEIDVVSNCLYLITGQETLHSVSATLLGPCKSIPQEYPNIKCRNIDLGMFSATRGVNDQLIDQVIHELAEDGETVVAYRNGERWTQTFEHLPGARNGTSTLLREGGVYLITGGLGNIGMLMAEELARLVRARLVLIGRSPFPPKENWKDWLATHDPTEIVSHRIRKVQMLESLGAEVLVLAADVGDEPQMRRVVDQIFARFDRLDGVIHGAGTVSAADFFGVDQAERNLCARHFQPKVHGLLVLEKLLRDRHPDFWLLLSSLSSVLGGIGFSAYAAANNFLDAFASDRSRSNGVKWISLNSDAWNFDENGAGLAMSPKEGVETFRQALSETGPAQLVVSVSDLQSRIDKWINLKSLREAPATHQPTITSRHARPELAEDFVAPRNSIEETIATLWQELLGIQSIGVHDNFFTGLGGHSLLATQVVSRLRRTYSIQLPLRQFFEAPTIEELAKVIAGAVSEETTHEQEPRLVSVARTPRRVTLSAPGVLEVPEELKKEVFK